MHLAMGSPKSNVQSPKSKVEPRRVSWRYSQPPRFLPGPGFGNETDVDGLVVHVDDPEPLEHHVARARVDDLVPLHEDRDRVVLRPEAPDEAKRDLGWRRCRRGRRR